MHDWSGTIPLPRQEEWKVKRAESVREREEGRGHHRVQTERQIQQGMRSLAKIRARYHEKWISMWISLFTIQIQDIATLSMPFGSVLAYFGLPTPQISKSHTTPTRKKSIFFEFFFDLPSECSVKCQSCLSDVSVDNSTRFSLLYGTRWSFFSFFPDQWSFMPAVIPFSLVRKLLWGMCYWKISIVCILLVGMYGSVCASQSVEKWWNKECVKSWRSYLGNSETYSAGLNAGVVEKLICRAADSSGTGM